MTSYKESRWYERFHSSDSDISIYVHMPFCVHKCWYCDFFSLDKYHSYLLDEYIQYLICEIEQRSIECKNRGIKSIFFGGGTPTALGTDRLCILLGKILDLFDIYDSCEITVETNPGIERIDYSILRKYGFNRVSVGCQSMSDYWLSILGRIHSVKDVLNTMDKIKNVGFNNINIDLIYGIENQNKEDVILDIEEAIKLDVQHISWYQLTLDEKTNPSLEYSLHDEIGIDLLGKNGFNRYEVSNYCKIGMKCIHNVRYWLYSDYIGFGSNAHGKIGNVRIENTKKIRYKTMYTKLTEQDMILEFCINTFRIRNENIYFDLFEKQTTLHRDSILQYIKNPLLSNFIEIDINNGFFRINEQGYQIIDSLLENLCINIK